MALKWSPVFKYIVRGESMEPTYKEGDAVLVNRLAFLFKKPKIGDVIVLSNPKKNIIVIKRIYKISSKGYFVVGDNKNESTDSRHFGWIFKKEIIGKVM